MSPSSWQWASMRFADLVVEMQGIFAPLTDDTLDTSHQAEPAYLTDDRNIFELA